MTKKAPYPYSPETRMWETLRDSNPKERDLVLRKRWVMQDAIKFNENFNEVNKTKILQKKVKDEIEKTFNWVTDFSHIRELHNLMWQYPSWDVTKIKLKPNCIEFEVNKWEITRLSVADLPGKIAKSNAFEEAGKFNLKILGIKEWNQIINLMPWNSIEEKVKNLKKLCNLKDWKYILRPSANDLIKLTKLNWGAHYIDFENWKKFVCTDKFLNIRGALK